MPRHLRGHLAVAQDPAQPRAQVVAEPVQARVGARLLEDPERRARRDHRDRIPAQRRGGSLEVMDMVREERLGDPDYVWVALP